MEQIQCFGKQNDCSPREGSNFEGKTNLFGLLRAFSTSQHLPYERFFLNSVLFACVKKT